MSATTTDEEIKRELAAEFPAWSIIHTDRGRWWAILRPRLDRRNGWPAPRRAASEIDTDTAEELRERLREVEAR